MFEWLMRHWKKEKPVVLSEVLSQCVNNNIVDIVLLIDCLKKIGGIRWEPNLAVSIEVVSKYGNVGELLRSINMAITATYNGDVVGMKAIGGIDVKHTTAYEFFSDEQGRDFNPNSLIDLLIKELTVLSNNCNTAPGLDRDIVVMFLTNLLMECVTVAFLLERLSHE